MKYCNCVKTLAVYYYWNSYTIHTVTYGDKEKTETVLLGVQADLLVV